MQTVEVRLWDDLAAKEAGDRVPAEVKVELTLAVQRGDGRKRTRHAELDLTGENADELSAFLARYFKASPPEGQEDGPGVSAGGKIRRTPPEGMTARDFRRGMRAWADGLGLVNRQDPNYPAWQTTTGKHYYPGCLEDGFLLFLQGDEYNALRMVAPFKPQAP